MKFGFYLLFFCTASIGVSAKYLEFVVRVKDYESNAAVQNAHGHVFFNGNKQFSTKANQGELMFKLEFNRDYVIDIEEEGHEKLTFKVNTTLPAEMTKFVYNFVSNVYMVKRKKGYKIVYTQDPSINVLYSAKKDQFTTVQQYSPSYNYVSENPTVEPVKPKKTEPKPIPEPIPVVDTLKKPTLVSREDVFDDRKAKSKQDLILIEQEREKEQELEMRNYSDMSKKRRSFMEEIADSRRGIKIVIFEQSGKRLP